MASAGSGVLLVLSSATRRGAETEAVALAGELVVAGYDMRVVALVGAASGVGLGVEVLGSEPLAVGTLRALRRAAKGRKVVIGYGSKSLPACALALFGLRTRFVYRNIGFPGDWLRGRLHRLRTRLLYKRVDHVVALWPGSAEAIQQLFGVEEASITVIPNARSDDLFVPISEGERSLARAGFGLGTSDRVVGLVGALSEEKRPGLAIHSAMSIAGCRLLIAGDGPLRPDIEDLAGPFGERVLFLGSVENVRDVFAAIDVLLLTSSTEGMPGVLIEAGLCGLPCVTTDVGASGEVIENGVTGFVVPASSNSAEIAAAVEAAFVKRAQYGAAAQMRTAREYSFESVVPLWAEMIDTEARIVEATNGRFG
jgi:glycosyltransferase involved in cell wall biosynthesis